MGTTNAPDLRRLAVMIRDFMLECGDFLYEDDFYENLATEDLYFSDVVMMLSACSVRRLSVTEDGALVCEVLGPGGDSEMGGRVAIGMVNNNQQVRWIGLLNVWRNNRGW